MGAQIQGEQLDGTRQADGTFRVKVDAVAAAGVGKTYTVFLKTLTSADSPYTIAAGATEISLNNTGSVAAAIKPASAAAALPLRSASAGGAGVVWRAQQDGTLEAVTVTIPVGAEIDMSIVR